MEDAAVVAGLVRGELALLLEDDERESGSFFFQAEDGIRDDLVTGVQTCALPISTLKDANGNALSGRVVTWASSAAAVATVDSSGVVTGVAVGGAMISATSEGQSGAALVSVAAVPAPVAAVAASPATASAGVGPTGQLTAPPKDASGDG